MTVLLFRIKAMNTAVMSGKRFLVKGEIEKMKVCLKKIVFVICLLFFGVVSSKSVVVAADGVVAVYKDGVQIGTCDNLLSAFSMMTDAGGNYTVDLSGCREEQILPDNYSWPAVQSISIKGKERTAGEIVIGASGTQTLNSKVTFSWLMINEKESAGGLNINIGGNHLIFDGEVYLGRGGVWVSPDGTQGEAQVINVRLTGTAGSTVEITGGEKTELMCDMDVDRMVLTSGRISFRGENKTYQMNRLDYYDGSMDASDTFFLGDSLGGQTILIDKLVKADNLDGGKMLVISLENSTRFEIGEVAANSGYLSIRLYYDGYFQVIANSNVTVKGAMDCVTELSVFLNISLSIGEKVADVVNLDKVIYAPNFYGTTSGEYSATYYFEGKQAKQELGNVSLYENGGSYFLDRNSFVKMHEHNYIEIPEDGVLTPGNDGKYYYYENGVMAASKEAYVDGAWRWFDADGSMAVSKDVYQTSSGGKWVRYNESGEMIKGEDFRYGGWYYFEPVTGTMMKGPVVLGDGRRVFYDTVTGQMLKGTHRIDGRTYVFDEGDGHLVSGEEHLFWVTIDKKKYWYENWERQGWDPSDEAYRGKEIYDASSDAWYWLDNVQQGAMAAGKDVYQESSGGKWVRYDGNGAMVKGWNTTAAGTYYFDLITGAMLKGPAEIDGKNCYFDENTGIMR